MTESPRKPFDARAFWSVLAAVTVVGLPWTGIENHLHQFEPPTLERHTWMAAHNMLATIFIVAVAAHVVLNRRPLLRHLRSLPSRLVPLSREALAALALTGALLLVSVGHARLAGDRGGHASGVAADGVLEDLSTSLTERSAAPAPAMGTASPPPGSAAAARRGLRRGPRRPRPRKGRRRAGRGPGDGRRPAARASRRGRHRPP
jgi:hypothetical protein